ncbi:MAG: MarR family winged helix-turn-helix transcriptional regulator [Deltaproteobacteria bacterium]|jgi:DNA-binding MarR family transcriptional regulator
MTQPSRDPSAPAPPLATPALDLMRLLLHVGHGLERLSLRMESRLGVTAQQRLVLRLIGRHPGITPGRLAERLHLDPGTISAIVRRLEAKKLVRRGSDPRDKRRTTLGLTEEGRALDRVVPGTVESVVERVLAADREGRIRATETLLTDLARALEQEATRPDDERT